MSPACWLPRSVKSNHLFCNRFEIHEYRLRTECNTTAIESTISSSCTLVIVFGDIGVPYLRCLVVLGWLIEIDWWMFSVSRSAMFAEVQDMVTAFLLFARSARCLAWSICRSYFIAAQQTAKERSWRPVKNFGKFCPDDSSDTHVVNNLDTS